MSKYSMFFIPFLFIFNCKNTKYRTITPAFHHWKAQLKLSDFEQNYCTKLEAKTLYLRFFDVDYDAIHSFAEPISESSFNSNNLILFDKIIPTIFITNRSLLKINEDKIDSLSTLISHKLAKNTEGGAFHNKIQEILIDCDWTPTTRAKYFQLIKQLKTLNDKKIVTTIRLHQLQASSKTGVPPADKGLLMVYNMGDLNDPQTVNSILDLGVLKSYIAHLDHYPLVLDLALPIFSWGIVQRDGQAVQLISNFSKDVLLKNKEKNASNTEEGYFKNNADNKITILKNGYYNGIYLYADDVIKIESVPFNELFMAAELLSAHIQNKNLTVSLFSLDSTNLKRYNSVNLIELMGVFK